FSTSIQRAPDRPPRSMDSSAAISGGISRPVNRRGIVRLLNRVSASLAISRRAGRCPGVAEPVEHRFDRRENAGDDHGHAVSVRMNPVRQIERGLLGNTFKEKRIERYLVRLGEFGIDRLELPPVT